MSTRGLIVCIALLLLAVPADGQEAWRDMLRYGEPVYMDAVQLPDSSGSMHTAVFARVAYDYLIFTKTTRLHPDSLYEAGVELTIDVLDANGRSVASGTDRRRLFSGEYSVTQARDRFVTLRRSFPLAAGNYTLRCQVADQGSTRSRTIELPVAVRDTAAGLPKIISILPIDTLPQSDGSMAVSAYGGSIPFAAHAVMAVLAVAGDDAGWTFVLRDRRDSPDADPLAKVTLSPQRILPAARLDADDPVHARGLRTAPLGSYRTFVFSLPFDTLDVGDYVLTVEVVHGEKKDTLTLPVRVLWRTMPFSLRDPEFAATVMKYILTEAEIDLLERGPRAELERRIRSYWKRRDPTPGTPFNEHMAEYFRRVDVAYFRFQTLTTGNGALTDRGKVFILHGEPERITRSHDESGRVSELWDYPSLQRSFRFLDRARNGNLRLSP